MDWSGYTVVYVRNGGTGDGSSPTNAFGSFNAAFKNLIEGNGCALPSNVVFDIGNGNLGGASSYCTATDWTFGIRGQGASVSAVGNISCVNGVDITNLNIISDRTITIGDIDMTSDSSGGSINLTGVICGNINTSPPDNGNDIAMQAGNVTLNNSTCLNINASSGPNRFYCLGSCDSPFNGLSGGNVNLTNNSICNNINVNGADGAAVYPTTYFCPSSVIASLGGPPGTVAVDGTSSHGTITANSGQPGTYQNVQACTDALAPNYCPSATINSGCIIVPHYSRNGKTVYAYDENVETYSVVTNFTGICSDYGFSSNGCLNILFVNGAAATGGWNGIHYTNGYADYCFNGYDYDYGLSGWVNYTNGIADPSDVIYRNVIYVRATGNDTTGNGSLSEPFRTAQKAFDTALGGYINDPSQTYILDFGTGSFNGINISTIGGRYKQPFWPQSIAIQGAGSGLTNLGNITYNFNCLNLYPEMSSSKIVCIIPYSINLGDINASIGFTNCTTQSNSADIVFVNCALGNIAASGGPGYGEFADCIFDAGGGSSAGNITLINSTCGDVTLNGGNGGSMYYDNCNQPVGTGPTSGGMAGSLSLIGNSSYASITANNGANGGNDALSGFSLCDGKYYIDNVWDRAFNGSVGDCSTAWTGNGPDYLIINGVNTSAAWDGVYYDADGNSATLIPALANTAVYDYFQNHYIYFDGDGNLIDAIIPDGVFADSKCYYNGQLLNGGWNNAHYTNGVADTYTGQDTLYDTNQSQVMFINGSSGMSGLYGYAGQLYDPQPNSNNGFYPDYFYDPTGVTQYIFIGGNHAVTGGNINGAHYTNGVEDNFTGVDWDLFSANTLLLVCTNGNCSSYLTGGYQGARYSDGGYYDASYNGLDNDYSNYPVVSTRYFKDGFYGTEYYNNIAYINGEPLRTWYFTNSTGDQLWSTLENWNSSSEANGFLPETVPWTDSYTANHNLYIATTDGSYPHANGLQIGGNGVDWKIRGMCDPIIANEILNNGLTIVRAV